MFGNFENNSSTFQKVQEITEDLVVKRNGAAEPQDRVSVNLAYCDIARIERLEPYCPRSAVLSKNR